LFFQSAFVLLQIFAEGIFSAELSPSSKVIDFGLGLYAILFEYPIDLFLFAPHDVPLVAIGLLPLAIEETAVDAISKGCFEFKIGAGSGRGYGGVG
jgi:hypothetical protein